MNNNNQRVRNNKNNQKWFSRPNTLKLTATASAVVFAFSLTLPSSANVGSGESTSEPPATIASSVDLTTQVQDISLASQSCGNPENPNGLAFQQMQTVNDMKKMIMTPINTDKVFGVANKGGCFDALKDFPDLSVSIPSLSAIANALKQTLIKYAVRKVCTAVNDALTELVEPINEVFDKIGEHGQIDLTGTVNKRMMKELYKIDPELGRIAKPVSDSHSWNLSETIDGMSNGVSYVDPVTGLPPASSNTPPSEPSNTQNSDTESKPKTVAESARSVISTIF